MNKYIVIGGFIGLLVGAVFGGAVAGLHGAAAGAGLGLVLGVLALGSLKRATAAPQEGATTEKRAVWCPPKKDHQMATLKVGADGNPVQIVSCSAFVPPTMVPCEKKCMDEMPPPQPDK